MSILILMRSKNAFFSDLVKWKFKISCTSNLFALHYFALKSYIYLCSFQWSAPWFSLWGRSCSWCVVTPLHLGWVQFWNDDMQPILKYLEFYDLIVYLMIINLCFVTIFSLFSVNWTTLGTTSVFYTVSTDCRWFNFSVGKWYETYRYILHMLL